VRGQHLDGHVPVFGVGEQDGLHYYVMQFIPGLGLDVVLDELQHLRRPRGKPAPTQAEGPGRPTHGTRDVSAAHVARALLSGEFRPPEAAGDHTTAPSVPAAPSSVRAAESSATIHLPGQSETSTLSKSGSQYWQSVARIGVQVADALAHAAGQGVLHRDIKPSNLLLDDTGNVWVTDFGLAKATTDGDNLTHTGDIVGTLRYMAPERFNGQGDVRSDVYSLGLTLYELLALRPAFDEADRNKLVRQVMHDEPARPRKVNPAVPRDLETVVLKAIARDPTHRYQTPAEMADDLKRFVEDRPVRARRISNAERLWRWSRRNPGIAVLGGVLTAVLLIATVVSLIVAGRMSMLAETADQNAQRAAESEQKTANALATVAAQKAEVEDSLSGSLEYFSAALKQADSYHARKSILAVLARFDMVLGAFVEQHPEDQELQLTLALRLAERGRQHLVRKQPAQAQAELEEARAIFRRLLATGGNWQVPTPLEMKAANGAKMELQKDGSVFVHQDRRGGNDTYKLVFQTELKGITGLRLEVLPDSRLPDGGPGWGFNGNFHLSELTLEAAPADMSDQAREIALRNARADFSEVTSSTGGLDVRGAVDGNPRTGWAVWPHVNQEHTAVFELAQKVGDGTPARLMLRLCHGSGHPDHNLGRFRLSFTNDLATLQGALLRQDLKHIDLADLHAALAQAYSQQGRTTEAVNAFTESLSLATDRTDKAQMIAEAARLEGVLEKLAERAAADAQFQAALARHFAAQGDAPLADATRAKARALFERQLAAKPDDAALASELAELLWSALPPVEYVWIDDAAPPGAKLLGDWEWVRGPEHPVFRGKKSSRSQTKGIGQHWFEGAVPRLKIGEGGARLFAYVYLDPQDPPKTVMLQFCDASFEHRAFWGEDMFSWGEADKASRLPMGPLPRTGEWVRLEVEAAKVGFSAGRELNGWAFTQHGGTCYWDAAGIAGPFQGPPWQRLAAAYHRLGDQQALETLVKHHPEAASGVGDLYAASQDWERAVVEYRKLVSDQRADVEVLTKLGTACQSAGRTRGGSVSSDGVCRQPEGHAALARCCRSSGVVRTGEGTRRHPAADPRVRQGHQRCGYGRACGQGVQHPGVHRQGGARCRTGPRPQRS
jgi:tetratricopeptide (TPR) repeat protein